MRAGSVAAAPFLGDQFCSLYLGEERVPTVPGKPGIPSITSSGGQVTFEFLTPESDGGSTITAYRFYVNDDFVGEVTEGIVPAGGILFGADESVAPCEPGDIGRVSAVNAVGEGPLSAPFTVVAE